MSSRSAELGALAYELETNFGETTPTTTANRLRPIGPVEFSPEHGSQKAEILKQRPNEGVAPIRMPQGGSISATFHLTGLGGATTGAAPASDLATLLGTVFGLTTTGLATGTTAASGSTATSLNTVAASGGTPGALVRVGTKGDGAADGQWTVIGSHGTSVMALTTGLPGAPAAGAVIHASRNVYESQTSGTFENLASVRFLYQTSGQQYRLRGCYPTAADFMINVGEIPRIKITWGISAWEPVSTTFPSLTAVQDHGTGPVAGGSMFMAAVGTATRSTLVARSVSMSFAMNTVAETGVNGSSEFQIITGATRNPATATVEMVIDTDAPGTDTFGDLFNTSENSRTNRHALYSMNVGEGRSCALYWPNLALQDRAVQFADGGVLRKRLRFEAYTGPTTTSDLTLSPWRLGIS